mmetsp:Transcript_5848/g.17919  ORF Transcript_5848/g.17919 Transcript_5848/m.17919 type:complete len:215 (-) Transcript_5848:599-1243(-)
MSPHHWCICSCCGFGLQLELVRCICCCIFFFFCVCRCCFVCVCCCCVMHVTCLMMVMMMRLLRLLLLLLMMMMWLRLRHLLLLVKLLLRMPLRQNLRRLLGCLWHRRRAVQLSPLRSWWRRPWARCLSLDLCGRTDQRACKPHGPAWQGHGPIPPARREAASPGEAWLHARHVGRGVVACACVRAPVWRSHGVNAGTGAPVRSARLRCCRPPAS